jgi:hypothetical protein
MHLFSQLREVEERFADVLVVISIHSAKFPSEQATARVRDAVRRYEVTHPVVNDVAHNVWRSYAIRAWPTLVFIDPRGRIIGTHEGELDPQAARATIAAMAHQFDAVGILDHQPLKLSIVAPPASALAFPGKVLADAASNRLFIADSTHHRIIIATLDGAVQRIIGSGQPGRIDGDPATARFLRPQGMALADDRLYVADTENHLIRAIDLATGMVSTVAGTGNQARAVRAIAPALEADLSSPWDLTLLNGVLYIAMAGLHQLWALDLGNSTIGPFAGSGREGIQDGRRGQAWLAQPSGITNDGIRLYFVDSETSAVRLIDVLGGGGGGVHTIVGKGLFDFGDVDGIGERVRLQHPLGICAGNDVLYVADSYNHKIKEVQPRTRAVQTVFGTGEPGHEDGPGIFASFNEPGGISLANNALYIADTNNHAIRVADLGTNTVSTLALHGLS